MTCQPEPPVLSVVLLFTPDDTQRQGVVYRRYGPTTTRPGWCIPGADPDDRRYTWDELCARGEVTWLLEHRPDVDPAYCGDVNCPTARHGAHWHAGPPEVLAAVRAAQLERIRERVAEMYATGMLHAGIAAAFVDGGHSEASADSIDATQRAVATSGEPRRPRDRPLVEVQLPEGEAACSSACIEGHRYDETCTVGPHPEQQQHADGATVHNAARAVLGYDTSASAERLSRNIDAAETAINERRKDRQAQERRSLDDIYATGTPESDALVAETRARMATTRQVKRGAFDVAGEVLLGRYGTLDPARMRPLGADSAEIGAAEQIAERARRNAT